jgi:acetolactate synthase regulatory subunit
MQWLITLDTEQDMIVTCRLLNVFRRKGLKIATLAMATRPRGFSVMAVLDSPESDIDHLYNYLRRTEGVEHVSYYQHQISADASFVFIDADADTSRVAEILKTFPGSKLIFASHGKYLLEVPAESRRQPAAPAVGIPEFLPFACVKTTRNHPRPELVGATAC